MSLDFNIPRTFATLEEVVQWAWENFKRAEQEFNFGRDAFHLAELFEEPRKPRSGMVCFASGYVDGVVGWDPPGTGAVLGDNKGYYGYYNNQWNRLG